jgi:hypothetical protein
MTKKKSTNVNFESLIQDRVKYPVTDFDIQRDKQFKKTALQVNKVLAMDPTVLQRKYTLGFYKDVKGDILQYNKYKYYKNPTQRIYFASENKSMSMHPFSPTRADSTLLTQVANFVGPVETGQTDPGNYILSSKQLPVWGPTVNSQGIDNKNLGYLCDEFFGGSFSYHQYSNQFINCYARHEFCLELMTNYDGICFPHGVNTLSGTNNLDIKDSGLHAGVLNHFTIPTVLQLRIVPHSFEPNRFDNIDVSAGAPAPPLECCTWDPGDSLPHFDFTYITKQGSQCRNLRWMEEASKWWSMFLVEIIPFFSSSELMRPLHFSKHVQFLTLHVDHLNNSDLGIKLRDQRTKLKKYFEEFNKDKTIYNWSVGTDRPLTDKDGTSYSNSLPAVGKYAVDFDFNVMDVPSFFLPPMYKFWSKDNFRYGNHPKVVEWCKNNPLQTSYTDDELYGFNTLQDQPTITDPWFDKKKNFNTVVKTGIYPFFTYAEKEHFSWLIPDVMHNKIFEWVSGNAGRGEKIYTHNSIMNAIRNHFAYNRPDGIWLRNKGLTRYFKSDQDPTSSVSIDPTAEQLN